MIDKIKFYFGKLRNHYQEEEKIRLSLRVLKVIRLRTLTPICRKLISILIPLITLKSSELENSYGKTFQLEEIDTSEPKNLEENSSLKKENILPQYRNSFKHPFVSEVKDAIIFGKYPLAIIDDQIISETLTPNPHDRTDKEVHSHLKEYLNMLRNHKTQENIDTAVLMHSRYTNYFHWTLEHLMKLRGVQKYYKETGNSVTAIIPPKPKSYIEESLEIFAGEEIKEEIEWNEISTRVDKLIVPNFPEFIPGNLQWLKQKGLDSVKDVERPNSPERLYISRQGSEKRKVKNYQELKEILDKFSIKPVKTEKMSFKEQMVLFRDAELIIGPHGAGLTNMVWSTDTKVIEIFGSIFKPLYGVLADQIGHEYTYISGESLGYNTKKLNMNIKADIEKIEKEINKTTKEQS
jgi:hypothetical protein